MTYVRDCTLPDGLLEQVAELGLEGLPELLRIVINAAMAGEREKHLGAKAYERCDERRGHANGYKPKTVLAQIVGGGVNESYLYDETGQRVRKTNNLTGVSTFYPVGGYEQTGSNVTKQYSFGGRFVAVRAPSGAARLELTPDPAAPAPASRRRRRARSRRCACGSTGRPASR